MVWRKLYGATQKSLHETTDEIAKHLKSSIIPEFEAKDNKICFESNNKILEKINNQEIFSVEKGNVGKCQ